MDERPDGSQAKREHDDAAHDHHHEYFGDMLFDVSSFGLDLPLDLPPDAGTGAGAGAAAPRGSVSYYSLDTPIVSERSPSESPGGLRDGTALEGPPVKRARLADRRDSAEGNPEISPRTTAGASAGTSIETTARTTAGTASEGTYGATSASHHHYDSSAHPHHTSSSSSGGAHPHAADSHAADSHAGTRNSSVSPAAGPPVEIKKMTDIKARACDECRRRKTACYYLNSENAKCFRCQMENIECTFSVRTRSTSQGSTAGPRQAPIPPRLVGKGQQQHQRGSSGPIEDYSQLPGRSLLKKTLSLQHPRSSFAVGQHGLWDQRVLEKVPLDKANQARLSPNLALRKVGPDSWFMIRNEDGQMDRAHDCDQIERLVQPYGRALVNVFFMFFQPEYPILHEKIFLEKYLRTYRELMPALLGAVYYLGMRLWSLSPELSTVPRPDRMMAPLYDATLMSFFRSSGGSSLSLVQAGLLLLQCSYADPRHLSICSVINAAAYRLALNRNCLHWKLPRWEINLRVRLSWAIYSQSTWVSLFESIPPLIADSSWFLSTLNPDMFDSGSNELIHNGALYIQLNRLSLIVHDMHNLLSSKLFIMYSSELSAQQATANNANVNAPSSSVPRASVSSRSASPEDPAGAAGPAAAAKRPGISTETILEMIKPIQLRLHDWYSKLPVALANIDGEAPTGNFSLRVAYIAAEITLHRFIMRAVCTSGVQASALNTEILKLLRSTARERLELAYHLLRSLRPQHLRQFWYFPAANQLAVIGVFAALMYTTSEAKEEADFYWALLKNYITILQLYSDNEVMSTALRVVRSSIAGVPGLAI